MVTDSQVQFEAAVKDLKTEIEKLVDQLKADKRDPDEWLRTLYATYAARMQSDTDRTWTIGLILIPVALAGFAAFVAIDRPERWHAIVLGLASSAVAWCWVFMAENYRAFRQKSEAWVVAIEQALGVKDGLGPKLALGNLNQILTFKAAVQIMRWVLVGAITVGWIVLCCWPWESA